MLVTQSSHSLEMLWLMSLFLRSPLVNTPRLPSGLAGRCGNYMVPLWLYQSLVILSATAALCHSLPMEDSLGLLKDATALLSSSFLPEGSVLWPVLGNTIRWWVVWSPFLCSHLFETSHTFHRMRSPSWHLHLVSCRPISCLVPTA